MSQRLIKRYTYLLKCGRCGKEYTKICVGTAGLADRGCDHCPQEAAPRPDIVLTLSIDLVADSSPEA